MLSLLIGFLETLAIIKQHLVVSRALRITGVAPSGKQDGSRGPEVDRLDAGRFHRVFVTGRAPEVVALVDDVLGLVSFGVCYHDFQLALHAVEGLVPAHSLPGEIVHVRVMEAQALAVEAGFVALTRDEDPALASFYESQPRHRRDLLVSHKARDPILMSLYGLSNRSTLRLGAIAGTTHR